MFCDSSNKSGYSSAMLRANVSISDWFRRELLPVNSYCNSSIPSIYSPVLLSKLYAEFN